MDALQEAKNQLAAAMTTPVPHDYEHEATHYALVSLAAVGIALVEQLWEIRVVLCDATDLTGALKLSPDSELLDRLDKLIGIKQTETGYGDDEPDQFYDMPPRTP